MPSGLVGISISLILRSRAVERIGAIKWLSGAFGPERLLLTQFRYEGSCSRSCNLGFYVRVLPAHAVDDDLAALFAAETLENVEPIHLHRSWTQHFGRLLELLGDLFLSLGFGDLRRRRAARLGQDGELLDEIVRNMDVSEFDGGHVDAKRRSGFLPLLERSHRAGGQAFMTATEQNWPEELGARLKRWQVDAGKLNPG